MRESDADSSALARRLRNLRIDLFGEDGASILARRLRIPQRTLDRMEAGRPISGALILQLIEVTGVNPHWLLHGEGERFSRPAISLRAGRRLGSRSAG
jgi:hypothetical protein